MHFFLNFILIIRLVAIPSPSLPERPNYSLNEDIKDGMYIKGFRLDDTSQTIDFNNISGYVGIAIKNIPLNASKVFVYVDHIEIGRWVRGKTYGQDWFGFESNRFSNGWHKVKLVSINCDGKVTNYPPIDAHFNNLLYNVIADDCFHPTEDTKICGFYNGGKSLEVKLTDIYGTVIWSNIYSGNYIEITIPGSAFGKELLCNINIKEVQSLAEETNRTALDNNEEQTRTSFEFFYADKYFVPPTDKTVAILLYPPYSDSGNYQPLALFGGKEITEKLMGESLEPIIVKGRGWLEKIMDAYKTALKESEERKFHRDNNIDYTAGQVVFMTPQNGYIREIIFDANTIYDDWMESSMLKEYFDELFNELGLMEESQSGKGNIEEANEPK